MSNKLSKYKKFIVVDSERFELLRNSSLDFTHLTKLENELLAILKNRSHSPSQRLKFYQQLLFVNISRKSDSETNSTIRKLPVIESTFNEIRETPKENLELSTTLQNIDGKDSQSGDSKANSKLPKRMATSDMNLSPIKQQKILPHNDSSLGNESLYESIGESETSKRMNSTLKTPMKSIYEKDHLEFDRDKEYQWLVDSIEEMSTEKNPDLRNMTFSHLEDPNSDFITVENNKSGEVITIEKSDGIKQQQRGKFSTPSRRSEKSLLAAQNSGLDGDMWKLPSTRPLGSRGKLIGSGLYWTSFEDAYL